MNILSDSQGITNDQDDIYNPNLLLFLNKILSRWWIFLLFGLSGILLAIITIRYMTPEYKISSKLLVEDEKKGGSSFNSSDFLGDMSSLLDVKSNIDNEVEILKGREMAEKVVRDMDLNVTYYKTGTLKNNQIFPSPFKIIIIKQVDSVKLKDVKISLKSKNSFIISYEDESNDKDIKETLTFNQPFIIKDIGVVKIVLSADIPWNQDGYQFRVMSIDRATELLQKEMSVTVANKMVSIIDISLNYPLPKKGEEILSRFIEVYMQMNIDDKNVVADSTIKFINTRLNLVSQELGIIENSIQTFKQKNQLSDIPEQAKLLLDNSNTNEKEFSGLKTQVNIIVALENYLNDESKSKSSVPSSILLQDAVFNKLSESYNAYLLDRERQLLTSTENNPYIKNLDQRISSIKKTMLANLASTKSSVNIRIDELQKNLNVLGSQIYKVPANERTYLGLFRQQSLKQELYVFMLQKREEVILSKTSNISSFKIIERPKSATKPYKPNGIIIIILGFVVGMTVPMVCIYISDVLNNRVQTKEDIEYILSIPIVGEISKVKKEELVINDNTKSILSEQFRDLRSNLNFFYDTNKGLCVMLTSSMEAEGKTFTTMNLGNILAITGKKVLIMDLDLRVANLTSKFELQNKIGFTNFIISAENSYKQLIYPSGLNENLFILPSGMLPPNPAETLLKDRTSYLIEMLKEEFHYIIIDTPPVGLVTDAQYVSKFVSLSLYIIRQNYTYKSQLHNLKKLNKLGKLGNIGIVFNDVNRNPTLRYGYGNYGKKQPDNFYQSIKKKLRFGEKKMS